METMAHLVRNLPFSKDVIFHCPMFEYCIKSTTESKSLKNQHFRGKSARYDPNGSLFHSNLLTSKRIPLHLAAKCLAPGNPSSGRGGGTYVISNGMTQPEWVDEHLGKL
jgi:hypothetical protein